MKDSAVPGATFTGLIQGFSLFIYRGHSVVAALTVESPKEDKYVDTLRTYVTSFEDEYQAEIPDWPRNISVFEEEWTIVSPDASDAERVKTLVFMREEGLTRADIAKILEMPVKKVNQIVKYILETDKEFHDFRDGRKRLVMYKRLANDEKS
jgi:hypothetical protein